METKNHPVTTYSQITEFIFIGSNFCCQTHFNQELLKKGIAANISLEAERLDSPFGVDSSLWLPTKDHTPPSPKQLKLGISHLDSLVKQKIKTYVHCMNGHGRAPTLVAAYFIFSRKSPAEAIESIKKKRPEIHLDKNQVDALKKYQKTLVNS